ncbi:TorD/DmsD family molecular chaperone [Desulfovibrio litoralis]|uniref:Chaperone TorD involved in molybdoenzyme TorA maturation n=1 Tax=Desulfovibrio litoralis DSM 11393 TaxID=1121455 RepID=A0A1M7TCK4_9BACT|nr:molecular chaperone TorD family protein [Desulfovibrio litoralis]SHN68474.1 chaperone TorD involved in molybdoenzyme TorA maturation [Desulfovibrio litoralis DSM 11393]
MQTIASYSKPLSTLLHFFGMVCYDFNSLKTKDLEAYLPYFPFWEKLFEDTQSTQTIKNLYQALIELCKDPKKLELATFEYNYLFHKPTPLVSLWESVVRSDDKLMFGPHSFAVQEWYNAFGLELAKPHEASDHIALEILFMANLIERMDTNISGKKTQDFDPKIDNNERHTTPVAEDIVWSFWNEHLGQWGPACIQKLIPHAKTEFWIYLLSSCYEVLSIMGESEQ